MTSSQTELLGIKVRQLRYRRGLTQAQLAGIAGVGEKTLKRLELGRTDTPHPETLAAVAGALGMRPEELFDAAGAGAAPPRARTTALPALHQLPGPPRNFTGREQELSAICEQVTRRAVPILAIHGMGGIGKTALSLAVAERLADRFPDGQFYLDLCGASEPMPTVDAMLHVIRSIEPRRRQPKTEAEVEAAYRSVLRDRQCLLLMDNAAGRRQVEALIPPEGSLLLLTSRLRFALPGEWSLPLSPLPEGESRTLIRSLAPHAEAACDRLAGACGGLPLALSLVARALAERPDLDPGEYAARLSDDQQRLQQLDAGDDAGGVEASFSLSYEMLDDAHRLGLCALSVCQHSFDRTAAAALWELDTGATDARIGTLVRLNLLEWSGSGGDARYRLHDLVRLFAAGRLGQPERARFALRHARHFLDILTAADRKARSGRRREFLEALSVVDREWGHIQAALACCRERAKEDPQAAALCQAAPLAATLLRLRLPPQRRLALGGDALDLLRARRDSAPAQGQRPCPGDHPDTGETDREAYYLVDCARAHQDLGDPRSAIACAQEALALCRARADRSTEAAALVALSDAHHALGAPAEAVAHGEQGLEIALSLDLRYEQALALVVLGWGYRVMGEIGRAIACCERALPIAREIGERAVEGSALLALAFAHGTHGKPAPKLALESLQIARELGDRRMEGYSLIGLGAHPELVGALGESLPTGVESSPNAQALAIAREVGDRRMEGHALLAIGFNRCRDGEPDTALPDLQSALEIARETGDRAMEGMALAGLGGAHAATDNESLAIELLTQNEEVAIEIGNHRVAARIAWFLGELLERTEDPTAALAATQRAAQHDRNGETFSPAKVEARIAALRLRVPETA